MTVVLLFVLISCRLLLYFAIEFYVYVYFVTTQYFWHNNIRIGVHKNEVYAFTISNLFMF